MDVVPENVLDRASPEPLYLQIKGWMLREIEAQRWPVHYKLPAEEDLARVLGVNRGTLRQALRELISMGKLTQIHGKGTFVSSEQLEQPLAVNLVTFSEDLISRDIPFQTQVLDQKIVQPDHRVASLLALPPNEPVLALHRVRTVQGEPLIALRNYIVLNKCPQIDQVDFTQQRLFEVLEHQYGLALDWGRRTFESRGADSDIAALLQVAPGSPIMYVEQVTYLADGVPIELSDIWFRGDRFRLSATVKRSQRAQAGADSAFPFDTPTLTLTEG